MSSAVSLRQVIKHYRRGKESVEVLHGLNLEIPEGEFVSLMGPSGSGKTTILNLVGGLDHADSGEIIVGGEHLEKLSGGQLAKWRSRHIGFIFQFYNLMPMLSAAGNVELPLLLTSLSKTERQRRVEVALDIVGLKDRAKHKPGEIRRPAAARRHCPQPRDQAGDLVPRRAVLGARSADPPRDAGRADAAADHAAQDHRLHHP